MTDVEKAIKSCREAIEYDGYELLVTDEPLSALHRAALDLVKIARFFGQFSYDYEDAIHAILVQKAGTYQQAMLLAATEE